MQDTNLKVLQSPAGWRQKPGFSPLLHPVEGIIKFDGTTFSFINSEGQQLVSIPIKDIKRVYVGPARGSSPQVALTLLPNSQANKDGYKLWFMLHKQTTETGKNKYLFKRWGQAFKAAGIRNSRTMTLWILLIAAVALIAVFVIANWSHTSNFSPGR
jgi:hypothetical protein